MLKTLNLEEFLKVCEDLRENISRMNYTICVSFQVSFKEVVRVTIDTFPGGKIFPQVFRKMWPLIREIKIFGREKIYKDGGVFVSLLGNLVYQDSDKNTRLTLVDDCYYPTPLEFLDWFDLRRYLNQDFLKSVKEEYGSITIFSPSLGSEEP